MSGPYDLERAADGSSYTFATTSGLNYFAYFTEFVLMNKDEEEVPIMSFGFTCDRQDEIRRYDSRVKQTIIKIINDFFETQPEDAVLYMCMDDDGKARNRFIAFGRWFRETDSDLEKHNYTYTESESKFYGSLILKTDHPEKQSLIDAFTFTVNFWLC